jgi:hypothetical protein
MRGRLARPVRRAGRGNGRAERFAPRLGPTSTTRSPSSWPAPEPSIPRSRRRGSAMPRRRSRSTPTRRTGARARSRRPTPSPGRSARSAERPADFPLSIRCQIGFPSEPSEHAFTNAGSAFLQVAEADGNRTRPPRIARRTGFEDREGHQSPFASEARIVVSGPPCSGPQRDGRAGAGRPATPHVLVTLELEQHPLAIEARGIAA